MTHCDGRACAMGRPIVYCVCEELKSFPWTMQPEWDSNWQNLQHYLLPTVPSTCATEDWEPGKIGLAFNVIKFSGLILLFVLVLFGWPMLICHKQTTTWFGGNTICNVMSLQLGNCPILAVPHSSTSANHQQQTTHKPNTCSVRQGFEFKSNCSQFLSFE